MAAVSPENTTNPQNASPETNPESKDSGKKKTSLFLELKTYEEFGEACEARGKSLTKGFDEAMRLWSKMTPTQIAETLK